MEDAHLGHVVRRGEQVIHKGRRRQLGVLVVDVFLEECRADALRDAAHNLAFKQLGVHDRAAVAHCQIGQHRDQARERIDLDNGYVAGVGDDRIKGAQVLSVVGRLGCVRMIVGKGCRQAAFFRLGDIQLEQVSLEGDIANA